MNLEKLDFNSPVDLNVQIANMLEDKIINLELPVGEKIPPVRKFCGMLGVSMETLRNALSKLEDDGYISRRRKYGTFVISSEPKAGVDMTERSGIYILVCTSHKYADFDLFSNTMHHLVMLGAQEKTRQRGAFLGYTIVYDDQKKMILGGRERELAGMIVTGNKTLKHLEIINKTKIPYILIGDLNEKSDLEINADTIINNDFEGAYMATKHLTELGHKRIAYIHDSLIYPWEIQKMEGYKKALSEANAEFDERLLIESTEFNSQALYRITKEFLEKSVPFTGFIGCGNNYGYGVIHAFMEKGIRVPQDVSLVDIGYSTEYTYVFYDLQELGQVAAERLYYRRANPGWKPERILVPHKLTLRNSTRKI
jgi:DNA-binding LacI/PurR family transcriptional regulator